MITQQNTEAAKVAQTKETPAVAPAAICSRDLWFCYSPDNGYKEYTTEELARKASEEALDLYRDETLGDGWSEEVWGIRYGKIIGWTVETMRKSKPPASELDEDGMDADGTYWSGEWDEICEYGISSENAKGVVTNPAPEKPDKI